jgi:hypothetical protein
MPPHVGNSELVFALSPFQGGGGGGLNQKEGGTLDEFVWLKIERKKRND